MREQVAELKEMLAEREAVIAGQKARLDALHSEPLYLYINRYVYIYIYM
jgi:hypothetical protein